MYTRQVLSAALGTLLAASATAQTLSQIDQYTLPLALSQGNSSFYLQSLGIDESTEQFVFSQYSAHRFATLPIAGGPVAYITADKNHLTGGAVHGGYLYFVSFTSNASGQDMHRTLVSGGSSTTYGTDVAAYGGFPIDIRDGVLYRTELSNSYNWTNLDQLWVSNVGTPNSFLRQVTVPSPNGIGDMAVDLDSNSLWVLEWADSAKIRQHDLDTGALIQEFQTVGDGKTAGITYYNGQLFYYDYVSTSSSSMTVFSIGPINDPGCDVGYDGYNLNDVDGDETCIHTTASVDETVQVDAGAHVGPNAVVAPRAWLHGTAHIGANVVVGRQADIAGTIETDSVVGRKAIVGSDATVGATSSLGYSASVGAGASLGPNTILGNLATIGAGASVGDDAGSGLVVVARSTTISDNGTVGSSTVIGPDCTIGDADLGTQVRVRKDAFIGDLAQIGNDSRIGRSASVGASADLAEGTHLSADVQVSDNACIVTPNIRVSRGQTVSGGCN
jgi:NDP-sugar pyrophosphorylase family protein